MITPINLIIMYSNDLVYLRNGEQIPYYKLPKINLKELEEMPKNLYNNIIQMSKVGFYGAEYVLKK